MLVAADAATAALTLAGPAEARLAVVEQVHECIWMLFRSRRRPAPVWVVQIVHVVFTLRQLLRVALLHPDVAVPTAKKLVRLWGAFASGGVRMVSKTDAANAQHASRQASRKFIKCILADFFRHGSGTLDRELAAVLHGGLYTLLELVVGGRNIETQALLVTLEEPMRSNFRKFVNEFKARRQYKGQV